MTGDGFEFVFNEPVPDELDRREPVFIITMLEGGDFLLVAREIPLSEIGRRLHHLSHDIFKTIERVSEKASEN